MQAIHDLILDATDKGYPPIVHFPHAIISIANYRTWRASDKEPSQWLYDMLIPFFSHSQGGGACVNTLLTGENPIKYITRWDMTHFHFFAYILTYWSPYDIVYRMVECRWHPLRFFCLTMDSLDAITTTCAVVDKAMSLHPKNRLLPIMTGIVMFNSGAFFRGLDGLGRGKINKSFLATPPNSGVMKGSMLAALYLYFGRMFQGGQHRNRSVVALSVLVVALDILEDIFGFDVFAHLHKPLHAVLKMLQASLKLGPSPQKAMQAN